MHVDDLTGTVFAAPAYSGRYCIGRVTTDLEYVVASRLLPAGSPISHLGEAVVVQMYDGIFGEADLTVLQRPVGIFAAIVEKSGITDGTWKTLGTVQVAVSEIEFPQAVIGRMHKSGETAFVWGEISLPLPFSENWPREVGCMQTRHSVGWWADASAIAMGYVEESEDPGIRHRTQSEWELRCHPRRQEVYSRLKKLKGKVSSYFEAAQFLGLDTQRFVSRE